MPGTKQTPLEQARDLTHALNAQQALLAEKSAEQHTTLNGLEEKRKAIKDTNDQIKRLEKELGKIYKKYPYLEEQVQREIEKEARDKAEKAKAEAEAKKTKKEKKEKSEEPKKRKKRKKEIKIREIAVDAQPKEEEKKEEASVPISPRSEEEKEEVGSENSERPKTFDSERSESSFFDDPEVLFGIHYDLFTKLSQTLKEQGSLSDSETAAYLNVTEILYSALKEKQEEGLSDLEQEQYQFITARLHKILHEKREKSPLSDSEESRYLEVTEKFYSTLKEKQEKGLSLSDTEDSHYRVLTGRLHKILNEKREKSPLSDLEESRYLEVTEKLYSMLHKRKQEVGLSVPEQDQYRAIALKLYETLGAKKDKSASEMGQYHFITDALYHILADKNAEVGLSTSEQETFDKISDEVLDAHEELDALRQNVSSPTINDSTAPASEPAPEPEDDLNNFVNAELGLAPKAPAKKAAPVVENSLLRFVNAELGTVPKTPAKKAVPKAVAKAAPKSAPAAVPEPEIATETETEAILEAAMENVLSQMEAKQPQTKTTRATSSDNLRPNQRFFNIFAKKVYFDKLSDAEKRTVGSPELTEEEFANLLSMHRGDETKNTFTDPANHTFDAAKAYQHILHSIEEGSKNRVELLQQALPPFAVIKLQTAREAMLSAEEKDLLTAVRTQELALRNIEAPRPKISAMPKPHLQPKKVPAEPKQPTRPRSATEGAPKIPGAKKAYNPELHAKNQARIDAFNNRRADKTQPNPNPAPSVPQQEDHSPSQSQDGSEDGDFGGSMVVRNDAPDKNEYVDFSQAINPTHKDVEVDIKKYLDGQISEIAIPALKNSFFKLFSKKVFFDDLSKEEQKDAGSKKLTETELKFLLDIQQKGFPEKDTKKAFEAGIRMDRDAKTIYHSMLLEMEDARVQRYSVARSFLNVTKVDPKEWTPHQKQTLEEKGRYNLSIDEVVFLRQILITEILVEAEKQTREQEKSQKKSKHRFKRSKKEDKKDDESPQLSHEARLNLNTLRARQKHFEEKEPQSDIEKIKKRFERTCVDIGDVVGMVAVNRRDLPQAAKKELDEQEKKLRELADKRQAPLQPKFFDPTHRPARNNRTPLATERAADRLNLAAEMRPNPEPTSRTVALELEDLRRNSETTDDDFPPLPLGSEIRIGAETERALNRFSPIDIEPGDPVARSLDFSDDVDGFNLGGFGDSPAPGNNNTRTKPRTDSTTQGVKKMFYNDLTPEQQKLSDQIFAAIDSNDRRECGNVLDNIPEQDAITILNRVRNDAKAKSGAANPRTPLELIIQQGVQLKTDGTMENGWKRLATELLEKGALVRNDATYEQNGEQKEIRTLIMNNVVDLVPFTLDGATVLCAAQAAENLKGHFASRGGNVTFPTPIPQPNPVQPKQPTPAPKGVPKLFQKHAPKKQPVPTANAGKTVPAAQPNIDTISTSNDFLDILAEIQGASPNPAPSAPEASSDDSDSAPSALANVDAAPGDIDVDLAVPHDMDVDAAIDSLLSETNSEEITPPPAPPGVPAKTVSSPANPPAKAQPAPNQTAKTPAIPQRSSGKRFGTHKVAPGASANALGVDGPDDWDTSPAVTPDTATPPTFSAKAAIINALGKKTAPASPGAKVQPKAPAAGIGKMAKFTSLGDAIAARRTSLSSDSDDEPDIIIYGDDDTTPTVAPKAAPKAGPGGVLTPPPLPVPGKSSKIPTTPTAPAVGGVSPAPTTPPASKTPAIPGKVLVKKVAAKGGTVPPAPKGVTFATPTAPTATPDPTAAPAPAAAAPAPAAVPAPAAAAPAANLGPWASMFAKKQPAPAPHTPPVGGVAVLPVPKAAPVVQPKAPVQPQQKVPPKEIRNIGKEFGIEF